MHRFFVQSSDIQNNIVQLSEEDTRHIRSLRLRPSEFFVVCDGEGFDFTCRLGEKAGGGVGEFGVRNSEFGINCVAEILDKQPSLGEPAVKCSVYVAFSKGDRLDYAVQKSVELGAFEIVLFPSARCVSIPADTHKKISRLQKIALETAKQSGRGRVPAVQSAKSYDDAIALAAQTDLPLFFYELEESNSLKTTLEQSTTDTISNLGTSDAYGNSDNSHKPNTISIVTGPEGGFEQHEAVMARNAGLKSVSLGTRILRSETAPVAALAAIMFFYGEM